MSSTTELTVVQLNDSHGYLDSHQELFWSGAAAAYREVGGFGRVAAVLDGLRRNKPGAVLAFDCGDTLHGIYPAVTTRGEALVPILNRIGFDAMTAHWEFAYGPERLLDIECRLNYPLLAINCYEELTDNLVFDPYLVREAAGLRVGIIGIAATIVDKVMPAHFSEDLRFTLGNEELPGHIATLREDEKVDLVVVISHLGFSQEAKLAREVDGIDVLLSGHTHNRLYEPAVINDTLLIQSGCHGSFLGRLDLQVENGEIVSYEHELMTLEQSIEPDPEVQKLVQEALAPYQGRLSQVLGHTATGLNRATVLESTMDNFLLQGLLDASGAQLAFSNGWRYGAPVPPGPVTLNDLYNIIPVDPPVSVCTLTGDELWTMMEENLERTFSRDPYQQRGGYVKRCMGLNLYFKVENPFGQRIQKLFVGGERVQPDRVYAAAFVTTQSVPAQYGSDRRELELSAVEALSGYLEGATTPIEAPLQGTIVAV
jgi:2',3'-cyclic-nucleotide 2'-phosphodiesterase (5'-nucleotidase family)